MSYPDKVPSYRGRAASPRSGKGLYALLAGIVVVGGVGLYLLWPAKTPPPARPAPSPPPLVSIASRPSADATTRPAAQPANVPATAPAAATNTPAQAVTLASSRPAGYIVLPKRIEVTVTKSDGQQLHGRLLSYSTNLPPPRGEGGAAGAAEAKAGIPDGAFELADADGKTQFVRWKDIPTKDVFALHARLLAGGTGQQWLEAGKLLQRLGDAKLVESAYAFALEMSPTLKGEVDAARRNVKYKPPQPVEGVPVTPEEVIEKRPGVTTAFLPECSNIVNLTEVAGDHFRFQCNNKIKNLPNWMASLHQAGRMPDLKDARTFGHFCIGFKQTSPAPITFDVQGWNVPKDATALISYIDPDMPEAFVVKDGKETWQRIKASKFINRGDFDLRARFTFTPERSPVWVAQTYPYSYRLHQTYMARLAEQAKNKPYIKINDSIKTDEGRTVHIIQIADGTDAEIKSRPTALIYAGEHATEPVSMQAAAAVANFLAEDSSVARDIRGRTVFLIIAMIDPDGVVQGQSDTIANEFVPQTKYSTAISLANFAGRWVASHRLDLAVSLHSSGGNMPNLQPAFSREEDNEFWCSFQDGLRQYIGLVALGSKQWAIGGSGARLGGWCEDCFGSVFLGYEINDNNTLAALQTIGGAFSSASAAALTTPSGLALAERISRLKTRNQTAMNRLQRAHPGILQQNQLVQNFWLETFTCEESSSDK